jgi:DNA-binding response OmpR family regulator
MTSASDAMAVSAWARILVVEDDDGIRETLKYNLAMAGYGVQEARDGGSALRLARAIKPDLIVLDLMLPGMSGLEVCRALRRSSRVPIIMITARDSEVDKIVGLELGADDYITKPFSIREVMARISAVLRRSRSEASERTLPERESLGHFIIDRAARRVLMDGRDVKLTGREFDLISYLVGHPERVHSRDVLLQQVWGAGFMGDSKTVDVHIRWLREKFAGTAPFDIVTVRGAGYRLDRHTSALSPMAAGGGQPEADSGKEAGASA